MNKLVIIIIIIIQDLCSNASLAVLMRAWVRITNNNNVFIVILFHFFFFISSNIGILSGQNIMCLTWQKSKHVIILIYFATLMPVACSVLCLPLLFALMFSLLFPCHVMDSNLSCLTYHYWCLKYWKLHFVASSFLAEYAYRSSSFPNISSCSSEKFLNPCPCQCTMTDFLSLSHFSNHTVTRQFLYPSSPPCPLPVPVPVYFSI